MQQKGQSEQRCFDAKLQKLACTVARHPTKLMQIFAANAKAEANARANIKVVTICSKWWCELGRDGAWQNACDNVCFSESDPEAHHVRDVLPVRVLGLLLLRTAIDPFFVGRQVEPGVVGVQQEVLHSAHAVPGAVGRLRVRGNGGGGGGRAGSKLNLRGLAVDEIGGEVPHNRGRSIVWAVGVGDHHGDTLVVHGDALTVRGGGEGRRLVQVRHQVDALLGVHVRQAGEWITREQGELLARRWWRHWIVEREGRIAFVLGADRSALNCAHQTQISSATNSKQSYFHPIR